MGRVLTEPYPGAGSPVDEAASLAAEFDIPSRKAAELLPSETTDGDDALASQVAARVLAANALEDSPVPHEPGIYVVADSDDVRLKPALHRPNDRTGSG